MRGTSGPLRRRRTPASPPCPSRKRYGEPRSPWSHGGQSRSEPSLNVRKEATTAPNLLPSPLLDDPSPWPVVRCSVRMYSSHSFRYSRYSSSWECVPPSDARSSLTKAAWLGPHRQKASEVVSTGLSHRHTPTRGTPGITNVGLALRHLLHLVVILNTLDSRRHSAIPFPQRIHWST